ncbi:hypothetical protein NE358_11000 [Sphingomonas sp. G5]
MPSASASIAAFAPGHTTIEFSPVASTTMRAVPVAASAVCTPEASTPIAAKRSRMP